MMGDDAVVEGEQVMLGDESYAPVCGRHYVDKVGTAGLAKMGFALPTAE